MVRVEQSEHPMKVGFPVSPARRVVLRSAKGVIRHEDLLRLRIMCAKKILWAVADDAQPPLADLVKRDHPGNGALSHFWRAFKDDEMMLPQDSPRVSICICGNEYRDHLPSSLLGGRASFEKLVIDYLG